MSEIAPDCPANPEPPSPFISLSYPGLSVRPSRYLRRLVFILLPGLALLMTLTLFQALGSGGYVWLLSLLCWLICALAAVHFLQWQKLQAGYLSVTARGWEWQPAQGTGSDVTPWQPVDDILLWNHLLVLPLGKSPKKPCLTLVLLPDSAPADEQRRLRVFLKTCHWKLSPRRGF